MALVGRDGEGLKLDHLGALLDAGLEGGGAGLAGARDAEGIPGEAGAGAWRGDGALFLVAHGGGRGDERVDD